MVFTAAEFFGFAALCLFVGAGIGLAAGGLCAAARCNDCVFGENPETEDEDV